MEFSRESILETFYEVLGRDNSLSRCCAVKALERVDGRDDESRRRLIELLLDPDPDVRTDAAATLGRLRVSEATDALLYNLENDPDGEVRIEAVKALSRIGSNAAVEPLIRCLEADGYPDLDDGDMADEMTYAACWEVHSQTLDALGKLGDARATEPVIALLENDEYTDLQESGFRVLAELSSERAREFLLSRLDYDDPLARRRAARALTSLRRLETESEDLSSELVNGLTSALMDPDPGVRIYAAQALAGSSNPLVVVPLTMLLADPETEVRREVASVLGKMRGRQVLDRLHGLVADPDPKVRRQVVQVLGEIGDPASGVVLIPLLETDDEDLLHEVIGAIGKIGVVGSETTITEILANQKAHFTVRIQAAKALGRLLHNATQETDSRVETSVKESLLDPKVVLAQSVFDQRDAVSQAALTALVDMDGENAAMRLVDLLRGKGHYAVQARREKFPETAHTGDDPPESEIAPEVERLIVGDDATTSTLAAVISSPVEATPTPMASTPEPSQNSPRHSVRLLAARLLGGLPAPGAQAVQALMDVYQDEDADLRREAIVALGRIGDDRALPVIAKGLEADEHEIRSAALDALEQLRGSSDADEQLVKLLDDEDPHIRTRAVETLGVMKSPAAIAHLPRMLNDQDREVCRATLRALFEELESEALSERIVALMFEFSGDLKEEAAAALRRLQDFEAASRLIAMLNDPDQEEFHWICIDALGVMFARESSAAR